MILPMIFIIDSVRCGPCLKLSEAFGSGVVHQELKQGHPKIPRVVTDGGGGSG